MINTVLFDLDGTLLPMELDEFIKFYFKMLKDKLKDTKYDDELLFKGIMKGTSDVVKNDGTLSNEDVFWNSFKKVTSVEKDELHDFFINFYSNEFNKIQDYVTTNESMIKAVETLKNKGYRLICATNPLFPDLASEARLKWSGVDFDAFEYITTYEDFHYCKPNPAYFEEVFEKYNVNPKECMMVGNDTLEDGVIEKLGVPLYLIEDYMINRDNAPINTYWNGSADKFLEEVNKMEKIA